MDEYAPLHAMMDQLGDKQRAVVLRAMHADVHAAPSSATLRVHELGFLARLLHEVPQHPDLLPYVERKVYTDRRPAEAPDAPTDVVLQKKYKTWRRACVAAWGLLTDGRNRYGPRPPGTPHGTKRPAKYTPEECVAAVRECAEAIGRIPSSFEYHQWKISRTRRAKQRGEQVRLPHYKAVVRELAPDRGRREGWQIVVARVFGNALRGAGRAAPYHRT